MNDSFFIDSSVALYLLDKTDLQKADIAFELLKRQGFISPQVLFECMNVCLRKFKYTKEDAIAFSRYLYETSYFQPESHEVVEKAFIVFGLYMLQSYDSKIVASALEAGCTTLYSEDMQSGLVIDGRLTIVNPFN
jgi:predicted nucleic acid-binding protein